MSVPNIPIPEYRKSKVSNNYADLLNFDYGDSDDCCEEDEEEYQLKTEKEQESILSKIKALSTKPQKQTGETMTQFVTISIGNNKATIDLSKVRKQGLIFEKSMLGRKPKIVIYYTDRPDVPEVNFELNGEEEAKQVYNKIESALNSWAENSNSARIIQMERELELMREQKTAIMEEKEILMQVFAQFKEMMQIMETENTTSAFLEKIESL